MLSLWQIVAWLPDHPRRPGLSILETDLFGFSHITVSIELTQSCKEQESYVTVGTGSPKMNS